MSNIKTTFEKLKKQKTAALIAYVMAGDPNPDATLQIADALIKGGVDILELGLPFSDPIADGPTIQSASTRALDAGTTPRKVLELAKQIKQKHKLPVVIMTYYNPVFRMGLDEFFGSAKECQVDGTIIPDLPLEEAQDYRDAAAKHGIDTIFLVTPATSERRLEQMVAASSGFVYLVSRLGVTGVQSKLDVSTVKLVQNTLGFTAGKVPLAVGFGVSKPEHVKALVEAGADGVIVGSVFVNLVSENQANLDKMLFELEAAAAKLKAATNP
jgi:tryptophan synthase alpha chain